MPVSQPSPKVFPARPDDGPRPVAVVLAAAPTTALTCAAGTLFDRLTDQLLTLPVRELRVVTRGAEPSARPDAAGDGAADGAQAVPRTVHSGMGLADDLRSVAEIARTAQGPLVLLPGDLVAHTEALALVLEQPDGATAALVGERGENGGRGAPVRVAQGRVAAAGNSFHRVTAADGVFAGPLRVAAADLATLADVATELADLAELGRLGRADAAEAGELLLTGLVRAGVEVRAVPLGRLHAARPGGQEEADAAIAALATVDEKAARLAAAVKSDDGFVATFAVSSWSPYLVRLAAWLRLTPNAVTGLSVGCAAIAATWFARGDRTGLVAGAAALYLSFVFDCVDGQLARYTRRFSPLGAWLDAVADRAKEYLVYAGLALGYAAAASAAGGPAGPDGIWALAVAAMILQAVRHGVVFAYGGARADAARAAAGRPRPAWPLSVPGDGPGGDPGDAPGDDPGPRPAADRAAPAGRRDRRAVRYLKKAIVLPIGERMALICVTAALADARVTFLALLGWGAVATAYATAGRIARSLA